MDVKILNVLDAEIFREQVINKTCSINVPFTASHSFLTYIHYVNKSIFGKGIQTIPNQTIEKVIGQFKSAAAPFFSTMEQWS